MDKITRLTLAEFAPRLSDQQEMDLDYLCQARDAALDADELDRVEKYDIAIMKFLERRGLLQCGVGVGQIVNR